MLSAILVPAPASAGRPAAAGPLMRTLAALVPATVDGVLRDVALLDLDDSQDVAALADEAGCRLVGGANFADAFAGAVASARSAAILVLKAGAVPSRLFGEEVARSLDGDPGDASALVLREETTGPLARMLPGRLAPVAGVILPRARLAGGRFEAFADVVRRARPAKPLPTPAFSRA